MDPEESHKQRHKADQLLQIALIMFPAGQTLSNELNQMVALYLALHILRHTLKNFNNFQDCYHSPFEKCNFVIPCPLTCFPSPHYSLDAFTGSVYCAARCRSHLPQLLWSKQSDKVAYALFIFRTIAQCRFLKTIETFFFFHLCTLMLKLFALVPSLGSFQLWLN